MKFKRALVMFLVIIILTSFASCKMTINDIEPETEETAEEYNYNDSDDIVDDVDIDDSSDEDEETLDKGIMIVSMQTGSYYTYKSTDTFMFRAFTVKLDIIDPETGEVSNFRTFSSEETHSCSAILRQIGGNTSYTRKNFDEDFSKMTATLTTEDGAVHVGWIDEDGEFTDVSEMIDSSSDFSGLTKHTDALFYDNYFYFNDATNGDIQIKRVPIDNLSPKAVEDMGDSDALLYILPDGSVAKDDSAFVEYYDDTLKYPANTNFFTDWVSKAECVGVDDDRDYIIKYRLDGKRKEILGVKDWYSKQTELVPFVEGRKNWSAVVSPDKKEVSFLSRLESGTDQTASLYTVSIDGGDPVKVDTDYDFPNDFSVKKTYEAGLLDWT